MQDRNMIKQDYKLVNAKYKLTAVEIKFIMLAIAQISTEDTELHRYEIKLSELEDKLQAEQNETRLRVFAKKLMAKPLELKTNNGFIVLNWFADIEYLRDKSKFVVSVSPKLKPYLLDLKTRFVKYNLANILNLKSSYSIKIYQLCKEYQKLQKRTFVLEELQELLQVPKSYEVYSEFKKKVLLVAQAELMQHCDCFFNFEEIKEGKKVVKLLFRIKKNAEEHQNQVQLFEAEKNKFDKFINKKILAGNKTKTIMFVEDLGDFLKVWFVDGGYAHVQDLTKLKEAIKHFKNKKKL